MSGVWFQAIFPNAESEDEPILLYSFESPIGNWRIFTPIRTFKFRRLPEPNTFSLDWNGESAKTFLTVFDALRAIRERRTGVSEWDESDAEASDYLSEWHPEVSDKVIFNFIGQWIDLNPNGTLRSLVDYFEHEDTKLVDRHNISGFLEEMIVTGQLTTFPVDWLSPSECDKVVRLAREYGLTVRTGREDEE